MIKLNNNSLRRLTASKVAWKGMLLLELSDFKTKEKDMILLEASHILIIDLLKVTGMSKTTAENLKISVILFPIVYKHWFSENNCH